MLESIETPTTLISQLHRLLEGKDIPVREIPELDTPLDYFIGGILQHSSREVAENCHPFDTSFSV
jgi:hypothetical protein